MKVALVSYPGEVKRGGETVQIIGVLPPSAGAEKAESVFRQLRKHFGGSLEIHKANPDEKNREVFQIIREVYVDSLQDARGKAEQFAAVIRDTFLYEPTIVPR